MTAAVLSLGANIGDRLSALQGALDVLARSVTVTAVSTVYETEPVGGVEQEEFLNVVALVSTDLPPRALLGACQEAERLGGRIRAERWGPRSIDVDVVAYGDVVSDDPDLTLPHPRAHERAFVLRPWLDVDPLAVLPGVGAVADLVNAAAGAVRPRADLTLRLP